MAEAMAHEGESHSNTVQLLGREITVEGGVYTVVFGALAVLTVIEVLSAEFLKGAIHDAPEAAAALASDQSHPAARHRHHKVQPWSSGSTCTSAVKSR